MATLQVGKVLLTGFAAWPLLFAIEFARARTDQNSARLCIKIQLGRDQLFQSA
jgi:hypothetical protein